MRAQVAQLDLGLPKAKRVKKPRRGRPPIKGRKGTPHVIRPAITRHVPVHVTMRIHAAVGSMRKRHLYKAIERATFLAFVAEALHIVHFSIQHDHLHAIVEASDREALSRGMQGFQISAAKRINAKLGRHGKVFPDRYHARRLTNPRQVRNAIAYVLNNWRHHGDDQREIFRSFRIDPYSSAIVFQHWSNYDASRAVLVRPPTYDPLWVYLPKSWLLAVGWQKHGPIDVWEIPGRST